MLRRGGMGNTIKEKKEVVIESRHKGQRLYKKQIMYCITQATVLKVSPPAG